MNDTTDDRPDAEDGDEPSFDVDAIDTDGDGTLDTTVITTVEGVDLDGDGVNDAALMTAQSMTDLDGDGLPDVIETTKTMIHDRGDGELHVVQTTDRVFVDHGDLDAESVLVPDDDAGLPTTADDHPVLRGERPVVAAFHHVSVNVDDLAAADHFYIDQLGLRRIARPDIGIGGTWLEAPGGIQVHLVELPGGGADANHMAFAVNDIDTAIGRLRAAGLEVPDWVDIGAGRQVFLRDPSGNIVELNQPTR